MRLLSAAILMVGVSACESPSTPGNSIDAIGVIDVRIGRERAEVPYARVRCWNDSGKRFALESTRVLRTRAATNRTPEVLIGKVSPQGEVSATAFQFGGTWSGETYDALTILAETAEGAAHDASCNLESSSGRHVLRCQGATPLPWEAPGGPPAAEFVAEFECEFEGTAADD